MPDQNLSPGDSLEEYRSYLTLLARMHVRPCLDAKADISGIVQQTMLDAHQNREKWASLNSEERLAYLQNVLANNALDEIRKFSAKKRDFRREKSLDQDFENSSHCLMNWAAADISSPSQQLSRQELALQLAAALDRLPESQREAVVMRYWERVPPSVIAKRMGRTTGSVAGLLNRGLRQLREEFRNWPN